jgi:endonuclease G
MKRNFFLAAVLGTLMMTSCSKDDVLNLNPEDSNSKVSVQFSSSINGAVQPRSGIQLRTGSTTWTANNTIGIFMVDNTPAAVDATANKAYITTDGSNHFAPVTSTDSIFYPVNNSTVNFIAYYPHQSGILLENNYNVDVSNQSNAVDIDFLYAKTTDGYSKTTGAGSAVRLLFDHKLTHFVLNTIAGEGLTANDLQGMTVTVTGLNTRTTFDLTDGTQGSVSTKANIVTNSVSDGAKYDAILVPQSVAANDGVKVEFQIGSELFVWKLAACEFESKTEHVYNVTISRKGVEIEGEINDWTAGTGGDVTAD